MMIIVSVLTGRDSGRQIELLHTPRKSGFGRGTSKFRVFGQGVTKASLLLLRKSRGTPGYKHQKFCRYRTTRTKPTVRQSIAFRFAVDPERSAGALAGFRMSPSLRTGVV